MTTYEAVSGSFDFGRVIQRTFRIVGDNFALFALGGLILVSGPVFFGSLAALKARQAGELFPLATIVGVIISSIGTLFMQGAMTYAVLQRLGGREASVGKIASVGLRFFFPLLGLAIVQGIGTLIGYMLLFVPGVILSVVWCISAPSMVIEERGIFEAMQRSRDLTRGHRWAIFGLFVVYVILSMILGMVVGGVGAAAGFSAMQNLGAAAAPDMTPVLVVSTFISSLVNGAQSMLVAAGVASIYYELRATKEGAAPQDLASVFD